METSHLTCSPLKNLFHPTCLNHLRLSDCFSSQNWVVFQGTGPQSPVVAALQRGYRDGTGETGERPAGQTVQLRHRPVYTTDGRHPSGARHRSVLHIKGCIVMLRLCGLFRGPGWGHTLAGQVLKREAKWTWPTESWPTTFGPYPFASLTASIRECLAQSESAFNLEPCDFQPYLPDCDGCLNVYRKVGVEEDSSSGRSVLHSGPAGSTGSSG